LKTWVVKEEEDDDGEENDQRWNEHEGEEKDAQAKGEVLAGEQSAHHEFEDSREHRLVRVVFEL
jgi:hypothetical protein